MSIVALGLSAASVDQSILTAFLISRLLYALSLAAARSQTVLGLHAYSADPV